MPLKVFYPDVAPVPVPAGHRFPTGKYELLRAKVLAEGILAAGELAASPLAERHELATAHDENYIDAMLSGRVTADAMRRIGLPWSETLARRSRATVGGSLAAARHALSEGFSGQLAGGTHHAHRDFGSGFCVFNDLAVAANVLLAEGAVRRIAIVDLDVHQGDGNAAILAQDPRVFVLSMHGEKNFPFRKVPSTLDVALPDGTGDRAYLAALASALAAVDRFRPDLALYLSGADPLESDTLGRLSLTHLGLAERDRMVLELFRRRGVPVSVAIGGGYAKPIDDSVEGYAGTFRVAGELFR